MTESDLKELRLHKAHLKAIEEQITEIKSNMLRGQSLSLTASQKGYKGDISDRLVKYETLLQKYYDIESDMVETWSKILDAFAPLPRREAMIMQLYYIQGKNLYDISEDLHYSTRWILKLKSDALKHLQEVPLPD